MGKLTRRPLSTAQTALSYHFSQRINASVSYLYTAGGETRFNGVPNDNSARMHRYVVSGNVLTDIARLTLQLGGDLQTETGFKEKRRLTFRITKAFQ